jgi:hypothetical protein
MLLLEVLAVGCCSEDGVSDALTLDLTVDGGEVDEAPKAKISGSRVCVSVS